jgi:hypothetical protein
MAMSPQEAQNREGKWLKVVGRLKPDVSLEQAAAAMNTIAGRLAESYQKTNAGWGVNLAPLHEELVGNVRGFLLTLSGAVLFVLLIACVNVANLLLARGCAAERKCDSCGARRRSLEVIATISGGEPLVGCPGRRVRAGARVLESRCVDRARA